MSRLDEPDWSHPSTWWMSAVDALTLAAIGVAEVVVVIVSCVENWRQDGRSS